MYFFNIEIVERADECCIIIKTHKWQKLTKLIVLLVSNLGEISLISKINSAESYLEPFQLSLSLMEPFSNIVNG